MHGATEEDAGHIAFLGQGQGVLDAVGHDGQRDVRHDADQFEHRGARVEVNGLAGAEATGRGAGDGLLLGRVLEGALASGELTTVGFETDGAAMGAEKHSLALQLLEVAPDGLLGHTGPLGNFRGAETASFIQFIQQPTVTINGKHEQGLGKCVFRAEFSQPKKFSLANFGSIPTFSHNSWHLPTR